MSALTEKTFPIRMDNATFARLKKQSEKQRVSIAAYIRSAFFVKLSIDEGFQKGKNGGKK